MQEATRMIEAGAWSGVLALVGVAVVGFLAGTGLAFTLRACAWALRRRGGRRQDEAGAWPYDHDAAARYRAAGRRHGRWRQVETGGKQVWP